MNTNLLLRHRATIVLQSVLLFGGLVALLGVSGYLLAGGVGLAVMLVGGAFLLGGSQATSRRLALKANRARPLPSGRAPQVYALVGELARRAGLKAVPQIHITPGSEANAFAVGTRDAPDIVLSQGLLRIVDLRQLAGILAHEITHLRFGDLRLMSLANTATALMRMMATAGMLLAIANVPLLLAGAQPVSWALVALLLVGPNAALLLQSALSRTREFHADLGAIELTGDPLGLALALRRVEHIATPIWARLLGWTPDDVPTMLRTHPLTRERIDRLLALAQR